jgi:hypothetical protein
MSNPSNNPGSPKEVAGLLVPGKGFLDLPTELRCQVYSHITPEWSPQMYRGLLMTCKHVYHEAHAELLRLFGQYYRAYQEKWNMTHDHTILIAPVSELGEAIATFTRSQFPPFQDVDWESFEIPLLDLPLNRVNFKFGCTNDYDYDFFIGVVVNFWLRLTWLRNDVRRPSPCPGSTTVGRD